MPGGCDTGVRISIFIGAERSFKIGPALGEMLAERIAARSGEAVKVP